MACESGDCPSRKRSPTSLSIALWRPTSSRSASSSPSAREQPGGVQPAGRLEDPLALAQPVGQGEQGLAPHGRAAAASGAHCDRDLLDRGLAADPAARRGVEVALQPGRVERPAQLDREHVVLLLGCARRRRSSGSTSISSRAVIRPSVARKPAASSKSWPGVRMVTATCTVGWPGPRARISSGSSLARRSLRRRVVDAVDGDDPDRARTGRAAAGGRRRPSGVPARPGRARTRSGP